MTVQLECTMILFLEDWKYHPRAIVDTKTSNKSFLAMADRYRRMGIENYFFMLALHNPELQGVDPFDPNLTKEQRTAIAYECKTNPWYFIREVARLPPVSGIEPMQYIANRGNIAVYWCFFNHITSILIQPRQTGKSGSIDILSDWIIDVAGNHTKMLMITKDAALQSDAISRIKGMRELLPGYIYSKNKIDADNKTGLNNSALVNEYKTGVARANKMAANNLGRGMTTAIVHIDEAPFITHIGTTFPAAQAAGTKARELAEKNGALWGTILTTTAGRRDDRDGGYMYDIVAAAWVWNEVIFDCKDRADAVKLVDRGCTGKLTIANITMSHRQLGYSDDWLYAAIRATGGKRDDVERDFLNIWNSGSMRSPLSTDITTKVHNSAMDPAMTEVTEENYTVRWYVSDAQLKMLKEQSRLVMGMDSSEASGRDAIALVITDLATMAVVGAATVGLTNLIEFAKWLAGFLIEHEEITLIPERKSTGQMIVDMLLLLLPQAGIDPFKRIFNQTVDMARENPKAEEEYDAICGSMGMRDDTFYTARKTSFGFVTTKARRDLLFGNVLQTGAKQTAEMIHDRTLINEILGLTVKNDRIDHSQLGHDDHVFAWLLCHYFASYAMNLSHYGILPGLVKSAMKDDELKEDRPVADRWRDDMQKAYLAEIEQLVEMLAECESEAMVQLHERRLQYLSRKVEASGKVKDFSVDAVMDRVRKERETRHRVQVAMGNQDSETQFRSRVADTISAYQASYYRQAPGAPW